MDADIDDMFGMRESASRRGSIASLSDRGSGSDRDDDEDDDGGRNNPMDEAMEVPDPERGGQQDEAAKVIKPKRVQRNPIPKIDLARVGGPRGILALQKCFKNTKFKGKGHEKDDLEVLLKHLEHWAHRLFPRYPFNNVLQLLEKLGNKKPLKVLMKRYRLDMMMESEVNREADDADMREDEVVNPEPVVDVFDELLGPAFPSSNQPAAVPPKPSPVTLTAEQRERVERNKKLAEERRLARKREQQNSQIDVSSVETLDVNYGIPSVPGDGEVMTDQVGDSSSVMDVEVSDLQHNQDDLSSSEGINSTEGPGIEETRPEEFDTTKQTSEKTESDDDKNTNNAVLDIHGNEMDNKPKENLCTEDDMLDMLEEEL